MTGQGEEESCCCNLGVYCMTVSSKTPQRNTFDDKAQMTKKPLMLAANFILSDLSDGSFKIYLCGTQCLLGCNV